jgi:hypothetical protein
MVTHLLTIQIKVDWTPSNLDRKGVQMKKSAPRRGFWDWVLGGGWASGGSHG